VGALNLSPSAAAALGEFARKVRATLGSNLEAIKLFGSSARGEADPESDLDVLIVVGDRRLESEDAVLDLAFDVNLAHDVYISPRVIERAVFEHPVWRITPFVQALVREGIPL
jgi:predicted nucleotidyltransferase